MRFGLDSIVGFPGHNHTMFDYFKVGCYFEVDVFILSGN